MNRFVSALCLWLTLAASCWSADLMMVVDTPLSEVPVNKTPLVDDSDYKSIEGAVAYNASGMALRWHFVATDGSYTVTSVTPTTSGTYDWTDQGDSGVYTIEIPASGGASINNDTEGVGWFTGVATGILPWTGPTIQFSSANINNSLVNGTAKLAVDVDTIKTNPVVNGGTITFPSNATLASTTNITAGTITTTTNLTNLPAITAGWLTATGIASDAFTAAKFAADCLTSSEISSTAAQEIADANRDFVSAITATQDGTTTTFEFTGGASVTDFYKGMRITTFDASNSSLPHEAVVTAYDGGTGILTFSPAAPYTIATGDTAVLQRASRTTYAAWLKLPSKNYLAGSSNSDGDVQLDEATGSLASGAIAASSFASGAIDATAIGANAIGSSELAADSITSSELATTAATEIWDNDPKLILSTTSTAGSSGTSLVLATAGLYDDSTSLVGATAYIYDASDSNKLSVRQITTWDGTLTNAAELDSAPDFTVANGDVVKIYTTPKVRVGTSGIVAASFAANAIDASAVAANAIGASEIANSAIDAATFATGAIDAAATAADFTLEVLAPIISDAASEPSSTPVANAPLSTKISWVFKGWRNGMTVTSSERTLLNDNGTEDIDWELSDDGTTATVTEAAAAD